jgi:YgiT-type zinc finger domain-containing protein
MGEQSGRCMFCRKTELEPATTTMVQQLAGVTVTIDGIPAVQCRACGEITLDGQVVIPIDEAVEQILIATRAMPAPDSEEDLYSAAESGAFANGQSEGDAIFDGPDRPRADEPSGTGHVRR